MQLEGIEGILSNIIEEIDVRRREYKRMKDNVKKIVDSPNSDIFNALLDKDPELIDKLESLLAEAKKRELK